ncbi:MAG: hypothetical protein JRI97_07365 [Deltaproteobacteria bacterium]|nr:hypothetical protein [Deltaproteobacteria bacterium]
MPKRKNFEPLSLQGISTVSLHDRQSKVTFEDFARPWTPGGSFAEFLARLPNILGAPELKEVIAAVARARAGDRPVIFAMGAHVIKTGLNPIVIDLMERGVITTVALNGAGIIHDAEVAMAGKTSEDVVSALGAGEFGTSRETAAFVGKALALAKEKSLGLGAACGRVLLEEGLPHADKSILAAGARLGVPVTVHVAVGTDIVHMHPDFDPAAAGAASHRDFRILAGAVACLESGVYINAGSAVILPEVFLKALSLARNLGHTVDAFTSVNLDFIRHYRPMVNVVSRPTSKGGRGIFLCGHHEIMIPLLAAGILEELEKHK